jgi:hypothetical protein
MLVLAPFFFVLLCHVLAQLHAPLACGEQGSRVDHPPLVHLLVMGRWSVPVSDPLPCPLSPSQVLFLTDPLDEAVVSNLAKYADKEMVDVSREGLQLEVGELACAAGLCCWPVLLAWRGWLLVCRSGGHP